MWPRRPARRHPKRTRRLRLRRRAPQSIPRRRLTPRLRLIRRRSRVMAKRLEITYVRSAVGRPFTQRRTVEALGLRRLHQTVHHDDTPTVRGMIRTVQHLLSWREIENG